MFNPTEISKEQAICMFFCVPYDPAVANDFLFRIERFGRLELCYEVGKPNEPMLLGKQKVISNPVTYQLYTAVNVLKRKDVIILS